MRKLPAMTHCAMTFLPKCPIMHFSVDRMTRRTDMAGKRVAGIILAAAGAMAGVTAGAQAQTVQPAPAAPPSPAVTARAADVESIDGIVAALYDVISGEAGKPRDWNRMRSLFAPEGRLMAVGARPEGVVALRAMTVEDYIGRNAKAFATMGFFEREAARTTETFGQIVHVFSTYESRHAAGDAKPFQRGINSIQLYNDGKRWWIVNLLWRAEDERLPLPERYLRSR
jgi:hypothetical protein